MAEFIKAELPNNHILLLDSADSDLLIGYHWYANLVNHTFYAAAGKWNKGRQTIVRIHRLVMERMLSRKLTSKERVDHVNQNGLDNRRCNLRLASSSQNAINGATRIDNTSGYRGVSWSKRDAKWCAYITVRGKQIRLGCFSDPEEAATVYQDAAKKYFGEFAPQDGK